MMRLIGLIKVWPGKPSHPPLTDASFGAYSVGVAMLVLGALGVQEEQMAHGSLFAIGGGLALALPTALTGPLDWLDIAKGTPARTIAQPPPWNTVALHTVPVVGLEATLCPTPGGVRRATTRLGQPQNGRGL